MRDAPRCSGLSVEDKGVALCDWAETEDAEKDVSIFVLYDSSTGALHGCLTAEHRRVGLIVLSDVATYPHGQGLGGTLVTLACDAAGGLACTVRLEANRATVDGSSGESSGKPRGKELREKDARELRAAHEV